MIHASLSAIKAYATAHAEPVENVTDWLGQASESVHHVRRVNAIFSPNQTLAQTYLFPARPDLTLIVELPSTWFVNPKRAMGRALDALQRELGADVLYWEMLLANN